MSTKRKKVGGNPAMDPEVAKTLRTLKATVELVNGLKDKLSPEKHEILRASSLGLMFVYSELTGLPDPVDIVFKDMVKAEEEAAWEDKPANQNKLLRRLTDEELAEKARIRQAKEEEAWEHVLMEWPKSQISN